jgi:hypothetical protein
LLGPLKHTVLLADRTAVTNIGNMTIGGGLAGAFDGIVNSNAGAAERLDGSNTGFVGKDYGAGREKKIARAIAYSATNAGFNGSGTPSASQTIALYGSNTSPSTGTDGTLLASAPSNNVIADIAYLNPNFIRADAFRYVWVHISGGASTVVDCAELVIYEFV